MPDLVEIPDAFNQAAAIVTALLLDDRDACNDILSETGDPQLAWILGRMVAAAMRSAAAATSRLPEALWSDILMGMRSAIQSGDPG